MENKKINKPKSPWSLQNKNVELQNTQTQKIKSNNQIFGITANQSKNCDVQKANKVQMPKSNTVALSKRLFFVLPIVLLVAIASTLAIVFAGKKQNNFDLTSKVEIVKYENELPISVENGEIKSYDGINNGGAVLDIPSQVYITNNGKVFVNEEKFNQYLIETQSQNTENQDVTNQNTNQQNITVRNNLNENITPPTEQTTENEQNVFGKYVEITSIAQGAFKDVKFFCLTIDMENIAKVGESAFENAENIYLENNQNGYVIGDCAFKNSTMALENNTMYAKPNGSKASIGTDAFTGSKYFDISQVNFDSNTISLKAAGTTTQNNGVTLIASETSGIIKLNASSVSGVSNINFTDFYGTVYFAESLARNSNSLQYLTLPKGTSYIGAYAFNGCSLLETVTHQGDIRELGTAAFSNCVLLTSINLRFTSLKEINNATFEGCSALSNVQLPTKTQTIGSTAFKGTALTSISLPKSVTLVKDYAFAHCTSLSEVSIPNDTTKIDLNTFTGCTSLSISAPQKTGYMFVGYSQLPDGYTGLEYIESTGTQWIDSGVPMNSKITRIYTHYYRTTTEVNEILFGCEDATGTRGAYFAYGAGGNETFYLRTKSIAMGAIAIGEVTVDVTINPSAGYFGTNYNGTWTQQTFDGYPESGENNFYLFNDNVSGFTAGYVEPAHYAYKGKLYQFKVWVDNVLFRDFLPCKNSSNVVGLWDTVSQTFFTNQGSGTFTAGPVQEKIVTTTEMTTQTTYHSLPANYTQVDYIETSGRQYIDTGFADSSGIYAEIKTSYTSTSSIGVILGSHNSTEIDGHWGRSFAGHYFHNGWFLGYGDRCPIISTEFELNKIYNVKFSTIIGNSYLDVDGTRLSSYTDTQVLSNNSYLFFITHDNLQNYGYPWFQGKLYSAKIWDHNNILVRDFIPCKNTNDEYGLWDAITGQFYGNQGSGNFTGGLATYGYDLPSNYTELEYIESTGTQYIDTGYLLNATTIPTFKVEIDQTITKTSGVWSVSGLGWNSPHIYIGVREDGNFGYGSGDDVDRTTSVAYNNNTRLIYTLDMLNAQMKVCGSQNVNISISTTISGGYWRNFWLFGYVDPNSNALCHKSKIYSCKMYDNNTLVRNFIPCKNANGECGLWDTKTGQFYANQGIGDFIAGPSMKIYNLPNNYLKLEYIESHGQEYINTGYYWKSETTEVVLDGTIMADDGSYRSLWGSEEYYSVSDRYFGVIPHGRPSDFAFYVGSTGGVGSFSADIGERFVLKTSTLNNNIYIYKNGSMLYSTSYSGTVQTKTASSAGATYGGLIYLFANHNTYRNDSSAAIQIIAGLRVYSFKMYDNNILVRNFIPCKNLDGECGLWDTVTGQFFRNQGSGIFTGPVIENGTQTLYSRYISGYQQVEYLESTGYQCINTDYAWQNENIKLSLDAELTTFSSYRTLFGSEEWVGDYRNFSPILHSGSSNEINIYYLYIGTGSVDTITLPQNEKFNIDWTTSGTGDYTLKVDNSVVSSGSYDETIITKNAANADTTYGGKYYLFSNHNTSNSLTDGIQFSTGLRIYSCKMYDNGVLVRNFIPCIRTSDGKPGLYDSVTGVFYVNQGSGADFTIGNYI